MLPNSALADSVLCASCALGFDLQQPLYGALGREGEEDNNNKNDNNLKHSDADQTFAVRVGCDVSSVKSVEERHMQALVAADARLQRVKSALQSAFVQPLCAHDARLVAQLVVAHKQVLATAAAASSRSQWHWFVSGPPSSGKTTLAQLLAHAVRLTGALAGGFAAPVSVRTAAEVIDVFGKGGLEALRALLDEVRGGVLVLDNAHELPAREQLTRHLADHMGDEASGKAPVCALVFVGLDAGSSSKHHVLQLDEPALRVGTRVPTARRLALAGADWAHLALLLRRQFDAHEAHAGRSLVLRRDFAALAHDDALWRVVPQEMAAHCAEATHRRLGLRLANEWCCAIVAARETQLAMVDEATLDEEMLRVVKIEELIVAFKEVK